MSGVVEIRNKEKEFVKQINNVFNLKHVSDGRIMIYYKHTCPCCFNITNQVLQVPNGFEVLILEPILTNA